MAVLACASALSPAVFAQSADGGADFNKADRKATRDQALINADKPLQPDYLFDAAVGGGAAKAIVKGVGTRSAVKAGAAAATSVATSPGVAAVKAGVAEGGAAVKQTTSNWVAKRRKKNPLDEVDEPVPVSGSGGSGSGVK
jgi:hypothetical protein